MAKPRLGYKEAAEVSSAETGAFFFLVHLWHHILPSSITSLVTAFHTFISCVHTSHKNLKSHDLNFLHSIQTPLVFQGGTTPETNEIVTNICSCHNFSPLSSVQILFIPACCLLCVL